MHDDANRPLRGDGTPTGEFLYWFRELQKRSGFSVRQLAAKINWGKSQAAEYFSRAEMPPLEFALAVTKVCHADDIAWESYWRWITKLELPGAGYTEADVLAPWDGEAVPARPVESFDYRDDGLFVLGEWSPHRTLETARVRTIIRERPGQAFLPDEEFKKVVAERSEDTGDVAYLTGFDIDHRESAETMECRFWYSLSKYAEARAIEALRQRVPSSLESADQELQRSPKAYLARALPSILAVNLIVISGQNTMLCARRSAAVDNANGIWTTGIFETLKASDLAGKGNVLQRLAERGLREELHLERDGYRELSLSWLGIYQPLLRGHAVAIVRSHLDEQAIEDRARQSESSYEHDMYSWLPLTRANTVAFNAAPSPNGALIVGATFEAIGKTWLAQSRLGLAEAVRWVPRSFS